MAILRDRFIEGRTENTAALVQWARERARPLNDTGDLDPLMERIGDAHFVLLGEASHGRSEYYTWRTAISEPIYLTKRVVPA